MFAFADSAAMQNDTWRKRILDLIRERNLSYRAVSIAAGRGDGYVHSILVDGKEPTIEHLARVCDALGISLLYCLYGLDASPATERLIRLMESNPDTRDGILQLLEKQSG